ncbi:MAG: competence/damage-inducible protein A [Candidatus Omnitrophica bacterium]|nr:competence/damage-inducible protein A [Candidatus Omnitrophota bacterium]
MDAEIIAIGTELLLGFTVNTDTVFLGRVLAENGINCYRQVTVGDNKQRLAEAIRTALGRADLVITCGGLGPTVDDITLETIAEVTGRPLILHRALEKRIRARFRRIGIRMPASNIRQATIPKGAEVLSNDIGTAPGFFLKLNAAGRTKYLTALPGPPAELMPMTKRFLVPRLKRLGGAGILRSRTIKVTGLTESEVDAKVADLLRLKGKTTIGIYAHPAQIDLRITARGDSPRAAERLINRMEKRLRGRLGKLIFGVDEETLEGQVGTLLKRSKKTLAVAESCTGGLLQNRLTDVAGSSDYFLGGIVAYSNDLKRLVLGVPLQAIRRHGAVSPEVARMMAQGVCRLTEARIGLSITGIAGPSGGSKQKPVGLVYIGLSAGGKTQVIRCRFSGNRGVIKYRASQAALNLLRLHLLKG